MRPLPEDLEICLADEHRREQPEERRPAVVDDDRRPVPEAVSGMRRCGLNGVVLLLGLGVLLPFVVSFLFVAVRFARS